MLPREGPSPDEELELDLNRFREFYNKLPDGRTSGGAKADQINQQLLGFLGSDGKPELWMAPKGTMEGWLKRADSGVGRPIFRPAKVLQACYEIWGADLTKDQCLANRFEVHGGAADLLEVGRVSIDRLPPGSPRPYLVRFERVSLTPKTRKLRDRNGRQFATASLGFFEASIVVELPDLAEFRKPHVLVEFLGASQPPTQFGRVIGATIRWRYPDLEWQMIKPHNEQVNSGQLFNAAMVEFAAETGEKVKLSIVVCHEDFHPVVRLDILSGDANDSKINEVRERLIAQVLKKRLDGKGRHVLASGNLVVE